MWRSPPRCWPSRLLLDIRAKGSSPGSALASIRSMPTWHGLSLLASGTPQDSSASVRALLLSLLTLIVVVVVYVLPSIVAVARRVPSVGSVIVVNIFLGWTLIGWVVALALAVRSIRPPYYYAPPSYGPMLPPDEGNTWHP